jgi:hypothetical protein
VIISRARRLAPPDAYPMRARLAEPIEPTEVGPENVAQPTLVEQASAQVDTVAAELEAARETVARLEAHLDAVRGMHTRIVRLSLQLS